MQKSVPINTKFLFEKDREMVLISVNKVLRVMSPHYECIFTVSISTEFEVLKRITFVPLYPPSLPLMKQCFVFG